jgi:hypothetical protein
MQRLFSMFPPAPGLVALPLHVFARRHDGLPGLALLLVRASVVLALLLADYGHRHVLPGWIYALAMLISFALSVGYLTSIAAAAALVFHGLLWFGVGVDSVAVAVIFALDAMALALVRPGAYSID